jgi:regulator of sirC expression with transglutaminase-like and TPR domain
MRVALAITAAVTLLGAACRRPEPPPPLTAALLNVGQPAAPEREAAMDAIADVAARVQRQLRQGLRPADALNHVVFDELAFAREIEDPDARFMRLGSVLGSRRGSCLGLAAVYLAVGERLGPGYGFSVDGVLVPGHFFVRVADHEGARNVELLRRGEELPESWYRQKYDVPAGEALPYLRALSRPEVLAVYDYNLGNDQRRRGRLQDAAASYARAVSAFPRLAEAYASLGLVRHQTGALVEAEKAYRAAWATNPHLPGLQQNLAVIQQELSRAGAP